MDIEARAKVIAERVRCLARRKYREGNFQNPYGECCDIIANVLEYGMCLVYNDEIEHLLTERICPCCGQSTRGDIDF